MNVIMKVGAHHLAVEPHGSGAAGRRTSRHQELRSPQAIEERTVQTVLGEHAIGAAIVHRQDGLAAQALAGLEHIDCDALQRLVPTSLAEARLPLGRTRFTNQGRLQSFGMIDVLSEVAHLAADEARGIGIQVRARDLLDAPSSHADLQAAAIGTVQGTGARFHFNRHGRSV